MIPVHSDLAKVLNSCMSDRSIQPRKHVRYLTSENALDFPWKLHGRLSDGGLSALATQTGFQLHLDLEILLNLNYFSPYSDADVLNIGIFNLLSKTQSFNNSNKLTIARKTMSLNSLVLPFP